MSEEAQGVAEMQKKTKRRLSKNKVIMLILNLVVLFLYWLNKCVLQLLKYFKNKVSELAQ